MFIAVSQAPLPLPTFVSNSSIPQTLLYSFTCIISSNKQEQRETMQSCMPCPLPGSSRRKTSPRASLANSCQLWSSSWLSGGILGKDSSLYSFRDSKGWEGGWAHRGLGVLPRPYLMSSAILQTPTDVPRRLFSIPVAGCQSLELQPQTLRPAISSKVTCEVLFM